MREIKFRAWHEKDKRFINWTTMLSVMDKAGGGGSHFFKTGGYCLMQFTGLLDKNGKEIYEGDILQRSNDRKSNFLAVIEFKNGMFGGATKPYDNHFIEMSRLPICDYNGTGYDEVIGNIYENLELITK